MATAAEENHQSGNHPDGGEGEAHGPAVLFLHISAGDGGDDRADIPRRIHQREAAIAAWIGGFVQLSQQAADVGFKQSVTADDDGERQIEEGRRNFAGAQHQMANGHQQRAEHHRHSVAEEFIGQETAENRRDVHQRAVCAEEGVGVTIVVLKLIGEIQNQQRPHAVKTEIFPNLQRDDVIDGARLR